MKKVLLTTLSVLTLLIAVPAMAMDMSKYSGNFADIDANGDGKIDKAEIVKAFPEDDGHRSHIMPMSDKNKDGSLDEAEWQWWMDKFGKKMH